MILAVLYLMKLVKDMPVVGEVFDPDLLYVADDALFVDEEKDTVAVIGSGQDAVFAADLAMGRAVRQQMVGDAAERFLPVLEAWDRIDGDRQNLSIVSFEALQFFFIRRDLVGADSSPCHWEKGQQDVLFAFEIGQPDPAAQM